MTDSAPGNSYFQAVLLILFALSTAYACGRLHQWYRQTHERDLAFREGYDRATRALFGLAAKARDRHKPADTAPQHTNASVTPITQAPSSPGRHAARRADLEATTKVLTTEQVTRAREARTRQHGPDAPPAVGE